MALRITDEVINRQPPEAQAIIIALLAEIQELTARINELEARLNKTPQNSSLPPGSQHPHAKPPRPEKKTKKRKQGGQPGHPKHQRDLIPSEECEDVINLKPTTCRRCGEALSGDDPQPLRHQVWELPVIQPEVIEYQRHRLRCPCCGESTCAELPEGVPTGQTGPRLMAFVALLMACFRQSKRRTAYFLEALLNQPCCPALTVKIQTNVTEAVTTVYNELATQLPDQSQLSIDESPTKERRSKAWLWTFVAQSFTVFAVRTTKGACVLDELLTAAFKGIVNCDRAKMYWQCGRLQWCWAHLKRDFQALIDSAHKQEQRLGHDLMRPTRKLFVLWARYRDGTLSRRQFRRQMAPIRNEINNLLLRGVYSGNARLYGMCTELYDHREWLWTFVDHEGIELTNNASERSLRHGVIWRKLSFGTQSAAGSRFVESMLTIIETCRQQKRPVYEYLTQAVAAHCAGKKAPSLLPRV